MARSVATAVAAAATAAAGNVRKAHEMLVTALLSCLITCCDQ
jgi:hypothetical protein